MSRKHMHLRRYDDTWSVKGVLITHPKRPTLSKHEAIGEGVLDWQDIAEQANCQADGQDIAPLIRVPREPYRSESADYDVRTKGERIMARIEASDRAKHADRRIVASQQPSQYGSLIQASTRRRTRR